MSADGGLSLTQALAKRVEQRRADHRYRQVTTVDGCSSVICNVGGKSLINFCSNDYLGLKQHPALIAEANRVTEEWGVGSGASHLVSGHCAIHQQLEQRIATWTGREKALVFSSGYMANLGVISALLNSGDCLVEDKLNHASLIDAAKLSGASLLRFNHNDGAHLEQRLQKAHDTTHLKKTSALKLVAVDGVYSMDGDLANLPQISELCREYDASLMVDDAHGFGCVGRNGLGSCEYWNMNAQQVPILMGTFGKALGGFGSFIAGSALLIDNLIQFARTYIYTTAMPPSVAAVAIKSIDLLEQEPWHRQTLNDHIQYFRHRAQASGLLLTSSTSAIQPIIVAEEDAALRLSEKLKQAGFWVAAIRPPTVSVGKSRLRITLSAGHSHEQIDGLITALLQAHV